VLLPPYLLYEHGQWLVAVTDLQVIVEIVGICCIKATNLLLIVMDIDYGYKDCVTDVLSVFLHWDITIRQEAHNGCVGPV